MDPCLVFDCQKALPNRYALAVAAAARTRALARGAAPRLDASGDGMGDLALREIASGAFTRQELSPFLPEPERGALPPPPVDPRELRGSDLAKDAAAPVCPPGQALH